MRQKENQFTLLDGERETKVSMQDFIPFDNFCVCVFV